MKEERLGERKKARKEEGRKDVKKEVEERRTKKDWMRGRE